MVLRKVISGGQTGVDRAALDAALYLGFPCGGWIPANRRAEDGEIAPHYPMRLMPRGGYLERNRRNVQDTSATLVLIEEELNGGTARTVDFARELGRPCLVIALPHAFGQFGLTLVEICRWLEQHQIGTLNIAGPRESKHPGIYNRARMLLIRLLQYLHAHSA
uniref:Molybdenum cofactor carrier n=1 Tax=Magnetococcus massalia (strain MO-1) TaxID=451514 RepID=A0A1S7LM99_MAGMO|nr:conserved protein of unknown function [Candidatus Magnetococcus massalia]